MGDKHKADGGGGTGMGQIYWPGDDVPASGIYHIVDADGGKLGYQDALVATAEGEPSEPFPTPEGPGAAGFVVHKLAVHMTPPEAERCRPGMTVPATGIYDVIDADGRYLDHQKVCRAGKRFPPFIPLPSGFETSEPDSYFLHERAFPRFEDVAAHGSGPPKA